MRYIKNINLFEKHSDKQQAKIATVKYNISGFEGFTLDEILKIDILFNYWVLSDNGMFKLIVIENQWKELELMTFDDNNRCYDYKEYYTSMFDDYIKDDDSGGDQKFFEEKMKELKVLKSAIHDFTDKSIEECKQSKTYKDNPPTNTELSKIGDRNKRSKKKKDFNL